MKHLIAFIIFLFLSAVACKKDPEHSEDKVHAADSPRELEVTDSADDFFDATFEADETEGDLDNYETEAVNPLKILKIASSDSMQLYKDPFATVLKKLKYAKRQIAFDTAKTRFTLYGEAFDIRSDSSKVLAIIKKDTLGLCEIVSWDTNKIVLDLPIIAHSYTNMTFSVRFKVFRKNPIVGKKSIYRTKSRACIGQTLAKNTKAAANVQKCADVIIFGTALAWRKSNLGLSAYSSTHNYFNSSYQGPQVGDILIEATTENFTFFGKDITGIVTKVNSPTDIVVESFIKESCTDPELYPRSHTSMRYISQPVPCCPLRKRFAPATATTDERFGTMYYEIYMR